MGNGQPPGFALFAYFLKSKLLVISTKHRGHTLMTPINVLQESTLSEVYSIWQRASCVTAKLGEMLWTNSSEPRRNVTIQSFKNLAYHTTATTEHGGNSLIFICTSMWLSLLQQDLDSYFITLEMSHSILVVFPV